MAFRYIFNSSLFHVHVFLVFSFFFGETTWQRRTQPIIQVDKLFFFFSYGSKLFA